MFMQRHRLYYEHYSCTNCGKRIYLSNMYNRKWMHYETVVSTCGGSWANPPSEHGPKASPYGMVVLLDKDLL